MTLHPRSDVFGTLTPTNMNGTPRPKLLARRPFLTMHHGGAGTWQDLGDTIKEIQAIQAFASSAGKATPWEYNYVVDSAGEAWTYAGEYQSAHSKGNNVTAISILVLNNSEIEQPTEAMILGVRQLRWHLQDIGAIATDHQFLQHRQMPGAATGCPGRFNIARWDDFSALWFPPVPPPVPPATGKPIEEGVMYAKTDSTWPEEHGHGPLDKGSVLIQDPGTGRMRALDPNESAARAPSTAWVVTRDQVNSFYGWSERGPR